MGDSIATDRILKIGPDRVTVKGSELIIEAKHPLADWQVREINPVPIYFEDRKYFLVEVRKAAPPFSTRYLLHPWPEGHVTNSKLFHAYDAETVAERDANRRSGNTDEVIRAFLLPLYPLLGLLWSGTQQRLIRFGFVPHLISGISVFTTFALAFAQAIFTSVMVNGSLRAGKLMIGGFIRAMTGVDYIPLGPVSIPIGVIDGFLLVAFIVDAAVRYSHYLREDQWAGGFLEWLLPKRKMNKSADE